MDPKLILYSVQFATSGSDFNSVSSKLILLNATFRNSFALSAIPSKSPWWGRMELKCWPEPRTMTAGSSARDLESSHNLSYRLFFQFGWGGEVFSTIFSLFTIVFILLSYFTYLCYPSGITFRISEGEGYTKKIFDILF